MAHEICFVNEKPMFIYDKTKGLPWHNLGEGLDGPFTVEDARARLNLEAFSPLEVTQFVHPLTGKIHDMHKHKGIFIPATEKIVDVPSTDYGTFDYYSALKQLPIAVGKEITDKILSTVGVLGDGERFFASVSLDDVKVGSEWIKMFLMLRTSLDRSCPIEFVASGVRPVCQNTVTAAVQQARARWQVKHKGGGSIYRKAHNLTAQVAAAMGVAQRTAEIFNGWCSIDPDENDVKGFVEGMFPAPKENNKTPDEAETPTAILEQRNRVRDIFESRSLPGQDDSSLWNLFNAGTYFVTHEQKTQGTRGWVRDEFNTTAVETRRRAFNAALAIAETVG